MLNVEIDENVVNQLLEEEIQKKVEKIASDKYFLTMKELSEYINLSTPVIMDRLIMNGCPHYKKGQKYLFRKKDVDQFLDDMIASLNGTNNIDFFNGLKKEASNE